MKLLNYDVGNDRPLFLIAGPCVVESRELTLQIAATLKEITQRLGVSFIFKASFDKANRRCCEQTRRARPASDIQQSVGPPQIQFF